MTVLLDSSVLVAASLQHHIFNEPVHDWLDAVEGKWASCPITQGSVLRVAVQHDYTVDEAGRLLQQLTGDERHEFWPDDIGYLTVRLDGVVGHRQVTDAYLAQLARARGERVATLDRGFAAHHADVAELVPTS